LTPDTDEWRELQQRVEDVVTAALMAAGVPF
jgi:hypothetical protein